VRDVFGENQHVADCWLMSLIKRCAAAVYAMSKYDCKQAMNLIDTLPNKVQGGAWALGLFGRCFYESAEYEIVSHPSDLFPYLTSTADNLGGVSTSPGTHSSTSEVSNLAACATWNGIRLSSGTWTIEPNYPAFPKT